MPAPSDSGLVVSLPDTILSLQTHTLSIEGASPGLGVVLQAGVRIACTTGIPLMDMLHDELGLSPEQTTLLDVFLLDGKPVDTPRSTPVPDGSRLALAAGLPGIAGLAMKSDSAVKGLRPGITHGAGQDVPETPRPRPGTIELVLYSLALKQLAPHFLQLGFATTAGKLLAHARAGLQGDCLFDNQRLDPEGLLCKIESLPPESEIFLRASL